MRLRLMWSMSIIDLICLTNNHTPPTFNGKGDNKR
jgi:hypothetical protein